MENITFDGLIGAVVVILALLTAYNTYCSARKNKRDEENRRNAPTSSLAAQVADHQRMLDSDKRRIDRLEADAVENKNENKLMMRMQLALIRHSIDGNNIADLKELREEVNTYLIERM